MWEQHNSVQQYVHNESTWFYAVLILNLLSQLLQVFSCLGCLGQQRRKQVMMFCHRIPTHSPSPCFLAISDIWLLSLSEKQFRSTAGRAVWNLGERTRGRPFHLTQLPKQISPRARMHLHHWRYKNKKKTLVWIVNAAHKQIFHVTLWWWGVLNCSVVQWHSQWKMQEQSVDC